MSQNAIRLISCLLAAVFLAGGVCCRAEAPSISASAYVLMDAASGRVLLSRNETEELPIASTTKIMTALVAIEHSSPDETVTVCRKHLAEGSSMYLAEGETLTMEALLYGLMLPSGNDAAECIADHCGRGTANFVRWMNEKAAALGMEHSAFANPSGLDADGHYSCALDMAHLMAYALREPLFARLISSRSAVCGARTMDNHNRLLGTVEGCFGGKTGYTGGAGRTLVTCAERGGLCLIAVTLHDGNDWLDHTALYDYGFSHWHSETALKRGEVCAMAALRGGEATAVRLVASESFSCAVADGETLCVRIEAPETLRAPLSDRQTLGTAEILLDGAPVGRVSLRTERAEKELKSLPAKTTLMDRLRTRFSAA